MTVDNDRKIKCDSRRAGRNILSATESKYQ
jgi:hypothetical protein